MNREKKIIISLILLVVILVGWFVITPKISQAYYDRAEQFYNQGINDALYSIAQQVGEQGIVPVINETGSVVWVQLGSE